MVGLEEQLGEAEVHSLQDLLGEFQMFRRAAESLEVAYRELKEQASQVDQELAEANKKLSETLGERERIIECLPVGVFRRDDGGLQPLNREAKRIEDCLGGSLEKTIDQIRARKDLGCPSFPQVPMEVDVEGPDGRKFHLQCAEIETGGLGKGLVFVDDQTLIREMRKEIERLDRLSSLSELALGIAHEIRNPLNGLAGFAGMLRRDPGSPRAEEWAERIEEGAHRVDRIVEDLLAFACPGKRGEMVVKPLSEWLLEGRAEQPGLEVVPREGALEQRVKGYRQAFGKVFGNLFRNAAEAGATKVEISVQTAEEGRTRITVSDDGKGIEPGIADKLFDPFVGTKEDGIGLGLAFCARVLESMGGVIRCAPGPGATFILDLKGEQA